MISTLIIVLCLVSIGVILVVYGIENVLKEDLELERQLKLINKSPIKTINVFYNLLINYLVVFF